MKNKSIRMNLIRLKKVIAAVLVISIFFVSTIRLGSKSSGLRY